MIWHMYIEEGPNPWWTQCGMSPAERATERERVGGTLDDVSDCELCQAIADGEAEPVRPSA